MKWEYIKNGTPTTYESGDWDGLRSDEYVIETDTGNKYIARLYEGYMDGSSFQEWYENAVWGISGEVVRYLKLPE